MNYQQRKLEHNVQTEKGRTMEQAKQLGQLKQDALHCKMK
jgi:hypothetical protein